MLEPKFFEPCLFISFLSPLCISLFTPIHAVAEKAQLDVTIRSWAEEAREIRHVPPVLDDLAEPTASRWLKPQT
jgi:hypothetical protein